MANDAVNNQNRLSKGKDLFNKKEYAGAVNEFLEAVKEDEQNIENQFWLGKAYYNNNQFIEALEILQKVVQPDEKDKNKLDWLGASYYKNNQYSEAADAYKKALQIDDKNKAYWDWLGGSYFYLEQYDEAIDAYLNALNLDKENAHYWQWVGRCYFSQKKFSEAVEAYEKAINYKKDNSSYWCKLGECHFELKKFSEAVKAFTNASYYDNKSSNYLFWLGMAYTRNSQYPEAVKTLLTIKEKYINNVNYWDWFSLALYENKQYPESIEALNKVFVLNKKSEYLKKRLVNAYYKNKQYKEALDNCEDTLVSLLPKIYMRLGIYQKSRELFIKARANNTWDNIFSNLEILDYLRLVFNFNEDRSLLKEIPFFHNLEDLEKYISQLDIEITEPQLMKIKESFFWLTLYIKRLLNEKLYFNPSSSESEIVHYSKIEGLKYMMRKDSPEPLMYRLSNAAYMNDPSEGVPLVDYLSEYKNGNELLGKLCDYYYNLHKDSIVPGNVYLFCFSLSKDILPMWGMYGDSGKGCCFVLDSLSFDERKEKLAGISGISSKDLPSMTEQIDSKNEIEYEEKSFYLYKVEYIKIDDKHEACDIHNEYIKPIIDSIKGIEKNIKDLGLSDEKEKVLTQALIALIAKQVDEIRYLFKSADYSYENELRLLHFTDIHSPDLCADNSSDVFPPRVYAYANTGKKIHYKEIILGTKVQNPQNYAPWLLNTGMVDKVSISKIKYR